MTVAATESEPVTAQVTPAPWRFWNGDRIRGRSGADVWLRADGEWRPFPDDGTGYYEDREMRIALGQRSATANGPWARFIPRTLNCESDLPGARLDARDLQRLPLGPVTHAVPYVLDTRRLEFITPRELAAARTEKDAAAQDLPLTMSVAGLREALEALLAEQPSVEVSIHRPAGRLYARYRTETSPRGHTLVYVLAAPLHV